MKTQITILIVLLNFENNSSSLDQNTSGVHSLYSLKLGLHNLTLFSHFINLLMDKLAAKNSKVNYLLCLLDLMG